MLRMTQIAAPRQTASTLRHWAASNALPDGSTEPLIRPESVVGFWLASHWLAVPWHDHDFYEVAFITRGTGYHFCGSSEERIQPGTVIFVPPGIAHGYRSSVEVLVYNCFFRAELAEFELLWATRDDTLKTLFGRGNARPEHVVTQLDPDALRDCIAELDAIREMKPGDRSHASEIGHLLLALDLIARHGVYQVSRPSALPPATPRVVSAAVGLIDQDPGRRWTLADLSREVYAGSFHLAHEFKRWMGVSPIAYANQRRVERAAALLTGTDDPIGAIGRALGWPDTASFSRHFHRAIGVSPREYRHRRDPEPVRYRGVDPATKAEPGLTAAVGVPAGWSCRWTR